jgi:hypothetical protein
VTDALGEHRHAEGVAGRDPPSMIPSTSHPEFRASTVPATRPSAKLAGLTTFQVMMNQN